MNRVQSVIYWSFFGLSGNGYFVFDRAPSSFIDFIGVLWGFSGFYWHLLSFLRVWSLWVSFFLVYKSSLPIFRARPRPRRFHCAAVSAPFFFKLFFCGISLWTPTGTRFHETTARYLKWYERKTADKAQNHSSSLFFIFFSSSIHARTLVRNVADRLIIFDCWLLSTEWLREELGWDNIGGWGDSPRGCLCCSSFGWCLHLLSVIVVVVVAVVAALSLRERERERESEIGRLDCATAFAYFNAAGLRGQVSSIQPTDKMKSERDTQTHQQKEKERERERERERDGKGSLCCSLINWIVDVDAAVVYLFTQNK